MRIGVVAIALTIAAGLVAGADSMQRSGKQQNLSGTTGSSKRMADGKEWTAANLNVNTPSSYDDPKSAPFYKVKRRSPSLRLARGALPGVSFLRLDEVIQLAPAVCAQQLEQAPVALQSHIAELGEVCCHPSPALL